MESKADGDEVGLATAVLRETVGWLPLRRWLLLLQNEALLLLLLHAAADSAA